MRMTIDNLDGLGPVDYTGMVGDTHPIKIQRALNVPSRCTADVIIEGAARLPVRHARLIVTADDATVLFTGYVATEPVRSYVGEVSEGSVYSARVSAVSDEWLLDRVGSGGSRNDGPQLSLSGSALIAQLTERAGGALSLASSTTTRATGVFIARSATPWSVNAGTAASAAYASYRAQSGQVLLQPAGSVTHAFSDADGTLAIAELTTTNVRDLANDVTLSGAEEPSAFITESFQGDGTTTIFELNEAAFRNSTRTLVADSFTEAALDTTQWSQADPGSHLSLTSAGLTMKGGNGLDGQTTVTAVDAIEMGGSILVHLSGVVFGAASNGILCGMYDGPTELAACFSGFHVRQSDGVTVVVPILNGAEAGTVFTPLAGHAYTLRLRLHCVEMYRIHQQYYSMVDGVVQSFGGGSGISAPMDVVFDLIDEGAASNTPATVLYDSLAAGETIAVSPATCAFVLVNSIALFGSISSVQITRPGSLWAVSTLPSGTQQTRLIGVSGEGTDCEVSYGTPAGTPGKLTFFAGRVPIAGERVTVTYRGSQRSIARLQNAASIATEAIGGAAGTCRWLGKVLQPAARNSVDCESAAQSVLAFASSRTAAVAGTYAAINPPQDIWPGDVLAITSAGTTLSLLVRSVVVEDGHAAPEVRRYRIAFANDWATELVDGLGIRLSEEIAADATLPQTAWSAPGQVLANLQQLSVVALTETALQVDAGTAQPAGGGFEVRRRDNNFGVSGSDLVLRSPVRSFTVPRASQLERFYVRMYDASTPPLYSRFSSATFINAPVS